MKYLILTTLLLIGCNSTMQVCEEYEVSFLLITTNKTTEVTKYKKTDSKDECEYLASSLNEDDYKWQCFDLIDNTGCN